MSSTAPSILIVDDDPTTTDLVTRMIESIGFAASHVHDVAQLWAHLALSTPNVILLDIMFGGRSIGLEVLGQLHQRLAHVPVIMISGYATVPLTVECMRRGAYDVIPKDLLAERLDPELRKAIELNTLKLQVTDQQVGRCSYAGLLSGSPQMLRLFEVIDAAAATDAAVLIHGEKGTRKDLVARAIHDRSRRARGPYVAANCAAIPHDLIESSLFGHQRGTGSTAQIHTGLCEQAHTGTLFLDQISDLNYRTQAKLLILLQDRTMTRVGARAPRRVDLRLITANTHDPRHTNHSSLRNDLLLKLGSITIALPPLRDRKGDIPLLVQHYLDDFSRRYHRPVSDIDPHALDALCNYHWPGNVRELETVIEHCVSRSAGSVVTVDILPPELLAATNSRGTSHEAAHVAPIPTIEEMERQLITLALQRRAGSVPLAAQALGVSEATIYRKIKRFGLQRSIR